MFSELPKRSLIKLLGFGAVMFAFHVNALHWWGGAMGCGLAAVSK
jgi:hypothetical protein